MAVRADDLALRDFCEHAVPVPVPQTLADVEVLVSEMIEFEDQWVWLAAVGAWMSAKELDEEGHPLPDERSSPPTCVIDVPVAIRGVVRVPIVRSAGPAVVVPLAALPASPGEVGGRLQIAAPSTTT